MRTKSPQRRAKKDTSPQNTLAQCQQNTAQLTSMFWLRWYEPKFLSFVYFLMVDLHWVLTTQCVCWENYDRSFMKFDENKMFRLYLVCAFFDYRKWTDWREHRTKRQIYLSLSLLKVNNSSNTRNKEMVGILNQWIVFGLIILRNHTSMSNMNTIISTGIISGVLQWQTDLVKISKWFYYNELYLILYLLSMSKE